MDLAGHLHKSVEEIMNLEVFEIQLWNQYFKIRSEEQKAQQRHAQRRL